ncbi:MAG: homogentisate 1,2-dioxygenase [Elusimicrobia bacterium]|nr:homogentisate 1,2-dioxygenase [Elusimicrobiota bacterium]
MAVILKRGNLPRTPHTEFYGKSGVFSLEEIHGIQGFSGAYSRKMHVRRYPTEQVAPPKKGPMDLTPQPAPRHPLTPYHMLTSKIPYGGDPLSSRTPVIYGPATVISIAKPQRSYAENVFFRNGQMHELYFVQEGQGFLSTEYGRVPFSPGYYAVVPKGTTYRIDCSSGRAWFFIIESIYPIGLAPHYLNVEGQAKLMAPVVETEIEAPIFEPPKDQEGRFWVDVKHGRGETTRLTLGHHPFDLAGWEGALYPYAFDIRNHHGIAREIHTAPPMHQTFQAGQAPFNGFSVCSFVSQMEGWHPKEIPAPYAHYNVDSDEVMFFSNAHYGARKGVVEPGSLTLHPGSLPHSPQGQAAWRSRASRGKMNNRLAVMLDTFFESLAVTASGYRYCDKKYALSWHRAATSASGNGAEMAYGT